MKIPGTPSAGVAVYLTPADVAQIEYALRTADFDSVMEMEDEADIADVELLGEQFTKLAKDIDAVTL